jgi:putative FmdB family regulatory protein
LNVPRYDYRCEGGHKYELQQPFGSPTEHECQKCGKPARRVVTVAPPLIFKAGGYYKTADRDFASDSASGSSTMNSASRGSKPKSSKASESSDSSGSSTSSEGGTSKAKKSSKSKPATPAD